MKVFKIDKKQQRMIEEFFKEELALNQNAQVLKIMAGLIMGISMILLLAPFRAWESDGINCLSVMGFVMFAGGLSINSSKYRARNTDTSDGHVSYRMILRYIPVDVWQLVLFRLRRIIKPCVITMAVAIMFRCAVSYASYGALSVWDIVLPLGGLIIIPIASELMYY